MPWSPGGYRFAGREITDLLWPEQSPGFSRFSEEALQGFKQYPWPGNIRELTNTI
jgi:DNA-binding NtrC family response regulator